MRATLRHPLLLLLVAVLVALALVGTSGGAGADPVDRRHGDGDEPLPGYTIVNPPLAPLVVDGEETTVLRGVHEHAAYQLEIPPDWNGELVMWAHGYRGDGTVLTVDPPGYGLRRTFVEQGYAWAASSYYANAYDVRAGVLSTRDLARLAGRLLPRKPQRTYVAGVSMGGHVIGRSLEEFPHFYDGALPMCGVLGDVRLFDFFLDYNLAAQALAGVDAHPFPADYQTNAVPEIKRRLGLDGGPATLNELGRQLRAVTINESGGPRPGAEAAFASWKDFLFTLGSPDNGGSLAQNPGRVATNLGRDYAPDSPVDLDAVIERVRPAEPRLRVTRRLTEVPRILGRPKVPVVTLHDLGDLFVPFSMEQIYAERVAANKQSDLLVQRAIRATGHCEFSPTEVITAWNDLRAWTEARGSKARAEARPAGDVVLDPAVVASPTYGCRFTDPTAYATGSRRLFAPCP